VFERGRPIDRGASVTTTCVHRRPRTGFLRLAYSRDAYLNLTGCASHGWHACAQGLLWTALSGHLHAAGPGCKEPIPPENGSSRGANALPAVPGTHRSLRWPTTWNVSKAFRV